MAYNPNFNPSYNNSGYRGGSGGGGRGGYGQQQRKRGRDDDYDIQSNFNRRRNNERGDYSQGQRNGGGGGGGFPQQGSYGQQQYAQQPQISPERLFRENFWKIGQQDQDWPRSIEQVARSTLNTYSRLGSTSLILSTFRSSISDLPHKLPLLATLISYLSNPAMEAKKAPKARGDERRISGLPKRPKVDGDPEEEETKDEEVDEKVLIGKLVVADLEKALLECLIDENWIGVRNILFIFTHLTLPASHPTLSNPLQSLIDPNSLFTLLASLLPSDSKQNTLQAPLRTISLALLLFISSSPSISTATANEGEGERKRDEDDEVSELYKFDEDDTGRDATMSLRDRLDGVMRSRKEGWEKVRDLVGVMSRGGWDDKMETMISTLSSRSPTSSSLLHTISSLLPPSPPPPQDASMIQLNSISLVEVESEREKKKMEEKGKKVDPKISSAGLTGAEGKGEEKVKLELSLFDDESVPSPYDPAGILLRNLIADIIDLYEINRKECAVTLLSLDRWLVRGVFKSRQPSGEKDEVMMEDNVGREWVLENLIVESIFSSLLALPSPALQASYYHSLVIELCRESPTTVAPAVGKCLRKLYAGLGDEEAEAVLDPEGLRRFADWFSTHLSNFGFMWGWKDWAPDMDLGEKHPKRVFVRRVIALEVRLSYYDRVKGTIPEVMYQTGVMADEAPTASYEYEKEDHKHFAAASSLLRLMRSKGTTEEVETELSGFQSVLEAEQGLDATAASQVKRDVAIQTLLFVGSRSFSHFLNVLERYLALLRTLSPSSTTRLELLKTLAKFWEKNAQFHLIVLDKLLQYRLVDAADVVDWVFESGKSWSELDLWTALSSTVKTVQTRLRGAKGRLEAAKEEKAKVDERELAEDPNAIISDEDGDVDTAVSTVEMIERELVETVSQIIKRFAALLPADAEAGNKDDWESWWVQGWYKEFCRSLTRSELLSKGSLIEAIEKLELKADSPAVTILDSAKSWHELV